MSTPVLVSSLHRLCRRWAPGCPNATLSQELVEAAREFCQESRWLRYSKYYDATATENTVDLESDDATLEVIGIKAVEYDGVPMDPGKPEDQPHDTGVPERYTYRHASEMLVYPTPVTDVADVFLVNQIMQPVIGAPSFPDDLTVRWSHVIAYGALSRLLAMPGAAWENEKRSVYYEDKFSTGKAAAMAMADMHHENKRFRTKTYYR